MFQQCASAGPLCTYFVFVGLQQTMAISMSAGKISDSNYGNCRHNGSNRAAIVASQSSTDDDIITTSIIARELSANGSTSTMRMETVDPSRPELKPRPARGSIRMSANGSAAGSQPCGTLARPFAHSLGFTRLPLHLRAHSPA